MIRYVVFSLAVATSLIFAGTGYALPDTDSSARPSGGVTLDFVVTKSVTVYVPSLLGYWVPVEIPIEVQPYARSVNPENPSPPPSLGSDPVAISER